MPDDLERYRELQRQAVRAAAYWLTVAAAAQDHDGPKAWGTCEKIAVLTKATFALVKSIGTKGDGNG